MLDIKRYQGYVMMRADVYEVLEWVDRELLSGQWCPLLFDDVHGSFGMSHTWVVKFKRGRREVWVLRRDDVYDVMPEDAWMELWLMDRSSLGDAGWRWVSSMRSRLGIRQSASSCCPSGRLPGMLSV